MADQLIATETSHVMIPQERLEWLQRGWAKLFASYDVPAAVATQPLDQVIAAYSAPERRYHTLEHLVEMFQVVGRLNSQLEDGNSVALAIWFHDVVYNTQAKDNEARSADRAAELLVPLGFASQVIERVRTLILATAHLTCSVPSGDPDTGALLDADLAILGSEPARYARYARDVRLEYHWVSEVDYRSGRSAVLRSFLARPRIYFHKITFQDCEERARENMTAELKQLES